MRQFRSAHDADIPGVMEIIDGAKAFLAAQGIDQWQSGYPDEASIIEDIQNENAYVLEDAGRICGTAAVVFGVEASYAVIHDGQWTTSEDYASIHRLAVAADMRGSGAADALMAGAEAVIAGRGLRAVRIDTHRENLVMQGMLARNGYTRCGTIYLDGIDGGAPREAFEKTLPPKE